MTAIYNDFIIAGFIDGIVVGTVSSYAITAKRKTDIFDDDVIMLRKWYVQTTYFY